MSSLESPFWRFSLALYQAPSVAQLCLDLQDRRTLDVNLLLYVIWAGLHGVAIDDAALARLTLLTAPLREEVIAPLRQARRALKGPLGAVDPNASASLRKDILTAELKAEQIQQALLFSQAPRLESAPPGEAITQAMVNATRLLASLPAPDAAHDAHALAVLRRALDAHLSHLSQ